MQFRFKGYGHTVWFIAIGAFFIVPPIIRAIFSGPEEVERKHIIGTVLALCGAIIFWIGARADSRNGVDVFSRHAWTSDLMLSEHVCFNVPMRLFGIGLIV